MAKGKQQGITVIELMLVLAIVAILGAVAYPAYMDSVKKGRRADGIAALLNLQVQQEKYRSTNTAYAESLSALDYSGSSSPDGYYALAIDTGYTNSVQFKITATAQGKQANDTDCSVLTVTQDGPDLSSSQLRDCWGR